MKIILLALSLLSLNCSPKNIIPIDIDTENSGLPANSASWDAVSHSFNSEKCVGISRTKVEEFSGIKTSKAEKVSIIVLSDTGNITFSPSSSGKKSNLYSLTLSETNGEIPEIWSSIQEANSSSTGIIPVFSPVTAKVNITTGNQPSIFEGATLTIPFSHNIYNIYQGEPTFVGEPATKEIHIGADGSWNGNVFPTFGTEVQLNLVFKGNVHTLPIPVEMIQGGDIVDIDLDFSGFALRSELKVNYTVRRSGKITYSKSVVEDYSAFYHDYSGLNRHYNVFIENNNEWESVRVHDALCSNAEKHGGLWNDWDNSKKLRDTMSFSIFEHSFDGPVKVRITKKSGSFTSAEIRPSNYNIGYTKVDDSTIEFTLPSLKQSKVSVEFDGDRYHNLFLYGYQPDSNKPSKDDANVKYYGPGEHEANEITLNSGQTLYLDYGAVLYSKVKIKGDNVTIAGHGILSGSKLRHWGGPLYSNGDLQVVCSHVNNITYKDFTIIDSPAWSCSFTNVNNVVVDGVNIINWELNGDGLDFLSCTNVEIKNCFLRAYDDCITLKVRFTASPCSDTRDIHIHDNLIFSDYARGIVVGPEAGNDWAKTGSVHDVLVEDCIMLNHAGGLDQSDIRAALAIGQYCHYGWEGGTALPIENITFRNIVFDSMSRTGQCISVIQEDDMVNTCTMRNILFENLTFHNKKNSPAPAIYINSNKHTIESLTIRNCVVDGNKITAPGKDFNLIGSGNQNIIFE